MSPVRFLDLTAAGNSIDFSRAPQPGAQPIANTTLDLLERDIAEYAHRVISIRDGKIASDEQIKKTVEV